MKKTKKKVEKSRGGYRPNSGRPRKNPNDPKWKKEENLNTTPDEPIEEKTENTSEISSETIEEETIEFSTKENIESDSNAGNNDNNVNQDNEDDEEIDFSQYKQKFDESKSDGKTHDAKPLEEPIPNKEIPKPPPVVIINGKILMAIINFLAPRVSLWISNFAGGDFLQDDFSLEEEELKILYPAADSVAQRIFANMPDYMQLIFGYGILSWSGARKKKRLREFTEKQKSEKVHLAKIITE